MGALPTDVDGTLAQVLRHLRRGPDSISGVARAVSDGRPRPVHRLTVAGYLQALVDLGLLREIKDPPARSFALANPEHHLDLHRRVGRAVREGVPARHRILVMATTLSHALGRPVFQAEMRYGGIEGPLDGLVRVAVEERQRRELRRRVGEHPIEVPPGDPLLEPEDPTAWQATADSILRRVALEATHSHRLAAPDGRPMQAALEPHGT